jgi:hypothetical protein
MAKQILEIAAKVTGVETAVGQMAALTRKIDAMQTGGDFSSFGNASFSGGFAGTVAAGPFTPKRMAPMIAAAKEAGEKTSQGFFAGLREDFGKGSTLGQFMKMAAGGGVIYALSQVTAMVEKGADAWLKYAQGTGTAGDALQEFMEQLPVIGSLASAGRKIGEYLLGVPQMLEEAKKGNEWAQVLAKGTARRKANKETDEAVMRGIMGEDPFDAKIREFEKNKTEKLAQIDKDNQEKLREYLLDSQKKVLAGYAHATTERGQETPESIAARNVVAQKYKALYESMEAERADAKAGPGKETAALRSKGESDFGKQMEDINKEQWKILEEYRAKMFQLQHLDTLRKPELWTDVIGWKRTLTPDEKMAAQIRDAEFEKAKWNQLWELRKDTQETFLKDRNRPNASMGTLTFNSMLRSLSGEIDEQVLKQAGEMRSIKDIRRSLLDIGKTVPGFQFASMVEGSRGITGAGMDQRDPERDRAEKTAAQLDSMIKAMLDAGDTNEAVLEVLKERLQAKEDRDNPVDYLSGS